MPGKKKHCEGRRLIKVCKIIYKEDSEVDEKKELLERMYKKIWGYKYPYKIDVLPPL